MPATFTVTTGLDVVNPADGKLSLREAITRANDLPGADIRSSIIAGNRVDVGDGPDLVGAAASGRHNLIGDGGGATGFTGLCQVGTAANPIDPALGPLAAGAGRTKTRALLRGSPAVDRGDNAGAPSADQRGAGRARDGDGNVSRVVDIGAFER